MGEPIPIVRPPTGIITPATYTRPEYVEEVTDSTGAGNTGKWVSWTPTLTNLTLGDGTVTARYAVVGDVVRFRFSFVLGAASAVGTNPTFTLPVTAAATLAASSEVLGSVGLLDSGVQVYLGVAVLASTTVCSMRAIRTDLAIATDTAIAAASPFAWAANDAIVASGAYEAA